MRAGRACVRRAFFVSCGFGLKAVCGATVAQRPGIFSFLKRFAGCADVDVCAPGRAHIVSFQPRQISSVEVYQGKFGQSAYDWNGTLRIYGVGERAGQGGEMAGYGDSCENRNRARW